MLNDFSSQECPVTAVDAETEALLDWLLRVKMASQFGEGQGLGPVLEWPAWLMDAVNVIQGAENAVENALFSASNPK